MDSLPDHVLGTVFSNLTSPADRLSVLLACKRFLSVAVAHSPALWESLNVSDNKGDRQVGCWQLAIHRVIDSQCALTLIQGCLLHLMSGFLLGGAPPARARTGRGSHLKKGRPRCLPAASSGAGGAACSPDAQDNHSVRPQRRHCARLDGGGL